jgi:hypothetical protein
MSGLRQVADAALSSAWLLATLVLAVIRLLSLGMSDLQKDAIFPRSRTAQKANANIAPCLHRADTEPLHSL